jgi:protein-S-isoprenylcysteine O-methyltransferase Ste14
MKKTISKPPGSGSRGELLVALQFLLLGTFILTPVFPRLRETVLYEQLAMIRWVILVFCWTIATVLGAGGLYSIRKYLTPLPYPVDDNRLVQTGVYALVRHPLYSSLLFAAAGWTEFCMSASHLLLTALGCLFFSHKAAKEEQWLTERHPEYRDYARKVRKFIPRIL